MAVDTEELKNLSQEALKTKQLKEEVAKLTFERKVRSLRFGLAFLPFVIALPVAVVQCNRSAITKERALLAVEKAEKSLNEAQILEDESRQTNSQLKEDSEHLTAELAQLRDQIAVARKRLALISQRVAERARKELEEIRRSLGIVAENAARSCAVECRNGCSSKVSCSPENTYAVCLCDPCKSYCVVIPDRSP